MATVHDGLFFSYLSGDLLCVCFVDGRGKSPVTMTHVHMCDKEIIRGSNHLLNAAHLIY